MQIPRDQSWNGIQHNPGVRDVWQTFHGWSVCCCRHFHPAAPAVPALTDLLSDDDLWLRVQAAEALAAIGEPARSAVPDLLKLVGTDLSKDDPRAMVQRYVAFALFYPGRALKVPGMISRSLADVDRSLLYSAMRAALQNDDGRARDAVGSAYGLLSEDEIEPLLPVVHKAVAEQSPSGVMFSDGIRLRGLELLAKHRVAEGLPLGVSLIEPDRWGSDRRFQGCHGNLHRSQSQRHLCQLKDRVQQRSNGGGNQCRL